MKKLLHTLAFMFLLASSTVAAAAEKPNIIFILTDDLGYGDVGYTWQEQRPTNSARIFTPNIDRLAREGIILSSHYCAAPLCAPSRASLMTGKLQLGATGQSNGTGCSLINHQFDNPIQEADTLATVLTNANYHTMAIGKWGIGGGGISSAGKDTYPSHPCKKGFNQYYGFLDHQAGHVYYHYNGYAGTDNASYMGLYENESKVAGTATGVAEMPGVGIYSTDLFMARAKKDIAEAVKGNPDKPFFLYLAINTVHCTSSKNNNTVAVANQQSGMCVPGRDYAEVKDLSWTELLATPEELEKRNTWIDDRYQNDEIYDTKMKKRYATSISRLDVALADLMEHLEKLGVAKNTIIVFTSDNGPTNEKWNGANNLDEGTRVSDFDSAGPFDGLKRFVYEGGMRVPTFVWMSDDLKRKNGITVKEDATPSIFTDWMATLADFAGTTLPQETIEDATTGEPTTRTKTGLSGVSLLPRWQGVENPSKSKIEVFYTKKEDPASDQHYIDFKANKGSVGGAQSMSRTGDLVTLTQAGKTMEHRLYNVVLDPHQDVDLSQETAGAIQSFVNTWESQTTFQDKAVDSINLNPDSRFSSVKVEVTKAQDSNGHDTNKFLTTANSGNNQVGNQDTRFTPATNIGKGGSWTATFTVDKPFTSQKLTLNAFAFSTGGLAQVADKTVKFTITSATTAAGAETADKTTTMWANAQERTILGTTNNSAIDSSFTFTLTAPITFAAGDTLMITCSQGTSTDGTLVGLKDLTFVEQASEQDSILAAVEKGDLALTITGAATYTVDTAVNLGTLTVNGTPNDCLTIAVAEGEGKSLSLETLKAEGSPQIRLASAVRIGSLEAPVTYLYQTETLASATNGATYRRGTTGATLDLNGGTITLDGTSLEPFNLASITEEAATTVNLTNRAEVVYGEVLDLGTSTYTVASNALVRAAGIAGTESSPALTLNNGHLALGAAGLNASVAVTASSDITATAATLPVNGKLSVAAGQTLALRAAESSGATVDLTEATLTVADGATIVAEYGVTVKVKQADLAKISGRGALVVTLPSDQYTTSQPLPTDATFSSVIFTDESGNRLPGFLADGTYTDQAILMENIQRDRQMTFSKLDTTAGTIQISGLFEKTLSTEDVTVTRASEDNSTGLFMSTSTGLTAANFFSPSVNIGKGGTWTLTLTPAKTFRLAEDDKIQLAARSFAGSGTDQNGNHTIKFKVVLPGKGEGNADLILTVAGETPDADGSVSVELKSKETTSVSFVCNQAIEMTPTDRVQIICSDGTSAGTFVGLAAITIAPYETYSTFASAAQNWSALGAFTGGDVALTIEQRATLTMDAAGTLTQFAIGGSQTLTFAGTEKLTATQTTIATAVDVSAIEANLGEVTIEAGASLTIGANTELTRFTGTGQLILAADATRTVTPNDLPYVAGTGSLIVRLAEWYECGADYSADLADNTFASVQFVDANGNDIPGYAPDGRYAPIKVTFTDETTARLTSELAWSTIQATGTPISAMTILDDATIQMDAEIAVPTTLAAGATLTLRGTGTQQTFSGLISGDGGLAIESGSVALTAENTYIGGTAIAGAPEEGATGATLIVSCNNLGDGAVTGAGTLEIIGEYPSSGSNTPILDNADKLALTAAAWTGVVRIRVTGARGTIEASKYGHADSEIEFEDAQGWMLDSENILAPVRLTGEGLQFCNGDTASDKMHTVTFATWVGDGAFKGSKGFNNTKIWYYNIWVKDASTFTGSIDIYGEFAKDTSYYGDNTALVIGPTESQSPTFVKQQIQVLADAAVTIPADRTWKARQGLHVAGTLGGAGTVEGALTLAAGSTLAVTNETPLTVTGAVTWSGTATNPNKIQVTTAPTLEQSVQILTGTGLATTEHFTLVNAAGTAFSGLYKMTSDENGLSVQRVSAVATVGDVEYATVQAAVDAAGAEGTVTILGAAQEVTNLDLSNGAKLAFADGATLTVTHLTLGKNRTFMGDADKSCLTVTGSLTLTETETEDTPIVPTWTMNENVSITVNALESTNDQSTGNPSSYYSAIEGYDCIDDVTYDAGEDEIHFATTLYGKGAWYTWEFNDSTASTGQMTAAFDNAATFIDGPRGDKAMLLRPSEANEKTCYIALDYTKSANFPEWSATFFARMPSAPGSVLVSFGTVAEQKDENGVDLDTQGCLALVAGAEPNQVLLVFVYPGNKNTVDKPFDVLAEMTVSHADTDYHLYTFVKREDGIEIYLDQTRWIEKKGAFTVGTGLQFGKLYGHKLDLENQNRFTNHGITLTPAAYEQGTDNTPAAVDMLRIFNCQLTADEVERIAKEGYQSIVDYGTNTREITTPTANWSEAAAWSKGTESLAEPTEGQVELTATVATTVTMNPTDARSLDGLTLGDATRMGQITIAAPTGEGAVVKPITITGVTTIQTGAIIDCTALSLLGPVSVADGIEVTLVVPKAIMQSLAKEVLEFGEKATHNLTGAVTLGEGSSIRLDLPDAADMPAEWKLSADVDNTTGCYVVSLEHNPWYVEVNGESVTWKSGAPGETPQVASVVPENLANCAVTISGSGALTLPGGRTPKVTVSGDIALSLTTGNTTTYPLGKEDTSVTLNVPPTTIENKIEITTGANLELMTPGIYAMSITGAGALSFATGNFTLTGENTYEGGTDIPSGAVVTIQNRAALGVRDQSGKITGSGELVIAGNYTTTSNCGPLLAVNGLTDATWQGAVRVKTQGTQAKLELDKYGHEGSFIILDGARGWTDTEDALDIKAPVELVGDGVYFTNGSTETQTSVLYFAKWTGTGTFQGVAAKNAGSYYKYKVYVAEAKDFKGSIGTGESTSFGNQTTLVLGGTTGGAAQKITVASATLAAGQTWKAPSGVNVLGTGTLTVEVDNAESTPVVGTVSGGLTMAEGSTLQVNLKEPPKDKQKILATTGTVTLGGTTTVTIPGATPEAPPVEVGGWTTMKGTDELLLRRKGFMLMIK